MNFIKKNLKVPKDLRHKFAEPLDVLIAGTREETIAELEKIFRKIVKKSKEINFYIVGDIVTQDFLSNGFLKQFIKICIIDEKTKRAKIKINTRGYFEQYIEFKNPQGIIHKNSWPLLKNAIESNKKTLITITEGEEDLLVIPMILTLELKEKVKNYVFYGQPPITDAKSLVPQGIVFIEVNKNIREKIKNLIKLMEEF
ncbi:MAG: DUF359 domain-containing protein [Promethearchaeota archaeon]